MSKILLVCGFPSSGTDLLRNIISTHSKIEIGGEFPLLHTLSRKYGSEVNSDDVDKLIEDLIGLDTYDNLKNKKPNIDKMKEVHQLSSIYSTMVTDKCVEWTGNKTPQNTEHIEELSRIFPGAKYILLVRDIRDVSLSWRKKWGKNIYSCASKWNEKMEKGLRSIRNMPRSQSIVLKYEDLIDDMKSACLAICDMLELEFDDRMLEYHRYVEETVEGKLNWGRPVIQDNKDKWKTLLKRSEVMRIEEIAYESMSHFNYEIIEAKKPRKITVQEKLTGFIHDLMSMIFIGNRAIENCGIGYRFKVIRDELLKRIRK